MSLLRRAANRGLHHDDRIRSQTAIAQPLARDRQAGDSCGPRPRDDQELSCLRQIRSWGKYARLPLRGIRATRWHALTRVECREICNAISLRLYRLYTPDVIYNDTLSLKKVFGSARHLLIHPEQLLEEVSSSRERPPFFSMRRRTTAVDGEALT